jgi:hypothetical protein
MRIQPGPRVTTGPVSETVEALFEPVRTTGLTNDSTAIARMTPKRPDTTHSMLYPAVSAFPASSLLIHSF